MTMRFSYFSVAKLILAGIAAVGLGGCTLSSKTDVKLDYYYVGGQSLSQIDTEIRKKGPRIKGAQHAVAVANIKMIPDVSFSNRDEGCIVRKAKVKVRATVTLPRWNNRKGAKLELARAWDNLDRYTRLHEAVHVAIADKYARLLEASLKALPAAESCAEARKRAKEVVEETMKRHEREQRKFDRSEKERFARLARSGGKNS